MSRSRSVAAGVAGYGLLMAAWVGANPPGSAPDEPAHHVKAVASALGEFTGTPVGNLEGHPPIRRPFLAHVLQTFRLPPRLAADPRWACNAFTRASADCLDSPLPPAATPATGEQLSQQSILGPYPPAPYAVIGAAALAAGRSRPALYAERMTVALLCLGLLAIALHHSKATWTRLSVLLAVTPTVLFISSAVTTSGIEITAGLAHTATVLALLDRPPGKRPWIGWALSGSVLVLARPLGPLWLASSFALLLAMAGWTGLRQRIRAEQATARPAIAALSCAAIVAVGWGLFVMPHDHVTPEKALHFLDPALRLFPNLVTEAVGVFGWLDVRVPVVAVLLIGAGWATLVGIAMVMGSARDRVILAICVCSLIALVLLLQTFTQMPFGFGAQARYVMPMVVSVLLFAGRTIDDGLAREAPRLATGCEWFPAVGATATAAVQWTGWYVNARRSAVGLDGPWLFLSEQLWTPPGGWIPWLAAATLGAILLPRGPHYCDARFSADVEGSARS